MLDGLLALQDKTLSYIMHPDELDEFAAAAWDDPDVLAVTVWDGQTCVYDGVRQDGRVTLNPYLRVDSDENVSTGD